MLKMSNSAYIAHHVSLAQAAERAGAFATAVHHMRLVLTRQGCGQVRREAMRHIDRLTAKSRAIGRAVYTYSEGPGRAADLSKAGANLVWFGGCYDSARLP